MSDRDTEFRVEYVDPDDQLVIAGTEEELGIAGVDVMAAELRDGRWMAWVPYHERPIDDHENPKRALSSNKWVSAGAVSDHYWGEDR